MTALFVLCMFAAFVALDVLVRAVLRRLREERARREREAVLEKAVNLDVSHEAPSLKRVEVENPKARILAVDDEAVVLDTFRRILVLDGCSVDTVEHGPEALGLLQRRDYDFLFTDLKMPDMSGVEVVRAAKHLRPDVDVVVVTGYATIESAVETLQDGACEYVQKPFSVDELTDLVRRLVIKRDARLEAARRPQVRVVAPAEADHRVEGTFCVPAGAFLSREHLWARLEGDGLLQVGIDDVVRHQLGPIDKVEVPAAGTEIQRGEALFSVHAGGKVQVFKAPVGGRITEINGHLGRQPGLLLESPLDRGWVALIRPQDLAAELPDLLIGKPAVVWTQDEILASRHVR